MRVVRVDRYIADKPRAAAPGLSMPGFKCIRQRAIFLRSLEVMAVSFQWVNALRVFWFG